MYSAAALVAETITPEDFPDNLTLPDGEAYRDESGYLYYEDDSTALALGTLGPDIDVWDAFPLGGNSMGYAFCLITDQPEGGFYTIEDQFEPTYSVTGTLTGTVTRLSLCVWSVSGITLRFNSTTQKWNVNGNEKITGNQSSPVGLYVGGFTVA